MNTLKSLTRVTLTLAAGAVVTVVLACAVVAALRFAGLDAIAPAAGTVTVWATFLFVVGPMAAAAVMPERR
jgi:hypothetical protein